VSASELSADANAYINDEFDDTTTLGAADQSINLTLEATGVSAEAELVIYNAVNSFVNDIEVTASGENSYACADLDGAISVAGDITVTGGLLDLGNFAFSGNITLAGGILVNSQGWTGQGTVTTPFTVDPGFLASLDTGSTFSVLPGMTADLTGITAAIDFRGGSLAGLGSYAGPLTVSAGTLDLTTATPLGTLALAGTGVIDFGGRELVMDIAYSGGSLLNADNYTGEITVTSASTTLVAGSLGGGIVIAGDGRQLVFGANFANNVRLVGGSVLNLENFGGTLFVGPGSSVNLGSIEGGTETVTLASIVLEQGGTLSGEGTLSALTLDTGGVLNVGNSPGVITIVNDLALNGGSQRFEVRQATDALTGLPSQAGVDYDLVEVGGVLDLSGLSASNTFLLELISLQLNDSPGSLADFDPNLSYSFTLYDFATYELGANSLGSLNSLFTINTDGFVDMNGGQVDSNMFSVVLDSSNSSLVLQYGVVPEPSTYGLMLGGLALALSAWRRRRQPPAAKA
jgi:hypothetical protein